MENYIYYKQSFDKKYYPKDKIGEFQPLGITFGDALAEKINTTKAININRKE